MSGYYAWTLPAGGYAVAGWDQDRFTFYGQVIRADGTLAVNEGDRFGGYLTIEAAQRDGEGPRRPLPELLSTLSEAGPLPDGLEQALMDDNRHASFGAIGLLRAAQEVRRRREGVPPWVRPACALEQARPIRDRRSMSGITVQLGWGGIVFYTIAYGVAAYVTLRLASVWLPGLMRQVPIVAVSALAGILLQAGDAVHEIGHAVAARHAGATNVGITFGRGAHTGYTFPPGREATTWVWAAGVVFGAGASCVFALLGLLLSVAGLMAVAAAFLAAAVIHVFAELVNALPVLSHDGAQFWPRLLKRRTETA